MKLQAKRIDEKNSTVIKNQLYAVTEQTELIVEEQQEDSFDRVKCGFKGNSEIYFCKEYIPPQIPEKGHKAADILVAHPGEKALFRIYDIKRRFDNDDEILHYVEQVNTTYYDAQGLACFTRYGKDKQQYRFGVISSNFPIEIIEQQNEYYKKELADFEKNSKVGSLGIVKRSIFDVLELNRRADVLSSIIEKKVTMEDGATFDLDVRIMDEIEGGYGCEIVFDGE